MKQYKTYIFDFDGTLADSIKTNTVIYQNAFHRIGMTCTEEEALEHTHHSLYEVVVYTKVPEKDIKKFADSVIADLDDPEISALTTLYPEVLSMLKTLKERGNRIGVVSGNNESHIRPLLKQMGIDEYIECVVGNESFKHPKPDPEPVLMGCQKLGVAPGEDVVYIGDSLQDYTSGHGAGCDVILVDRYRAYGDFEGQKVFSLDQILE